MSEPTAPPLAYFITFTTYGTRLHGDERGTVDRHRNQPGSPVVPGCDPRHRHERDSLRNPPFVMDAAQRTVVRRTIEQVCGHRDWRLHALNVRTNHVHLVVTAAGAPEPVMGSLKSWATRRLREAGLVARGRRQWTEHGSTEYLWNVESVCSACRYVVDGQGDDLPGANQ